MDPACVSTVPARLAKPARAAFPRNPERARFAILAHERPHFRHRVEQPLLQSCSELHALLYPTGQDEQSVRRTHTIHLLDQQTLSSDLQDVRIVKPPRSRFVLNRNQHASSTHELIGPANEPVTGGVQRGCWTCRIVRGNHCLIRQPKLGALPASRAIQIAQEHQTKDQCEGEHYHGRTNVPALKSSIARIIASPKLATRSIRRPSSTARTRSARPPICR
jgi:hypothetical protein